MIWKQRSRCLFSALQTRTEHKPNMCRSKLRSTPNFRAPSTNFNRRGTFATKFQNWVTTIRLKKRSQILHFVWMDFCMSISGMLFNDMLISWKFDSFCSWSPIIFGPCQLIVNFPLWSILCVTASWNIQYHLVFGACRLYSSRSRKFIYWKTSKKLVGN